MPELKYKIAKEISRKDILFCIARVPNSQKLFVGSSDGNVYALDAGAEKPEAIALAGHAGYVTGLALGAGDVLVSGASDGQLIWWNATTRAPLRIVKSHNKWVRA